jgi:hypothetical protein
MNKQYTVLALQTLGTNQTTGWAAASSQSALTCSSASNRKTCTGGGSSIIVPTQVHGKAGALK